MMAQRVFMNNRKGRKQAAKCAKLLRRMIKYFQRPENR